MFDEGLLDGAIKSVWDPTANTSGHVALTNGNRTATHDGSPGTPSGIRGALGYSQGKHYFEVAASAQSQSGITKVAYVGSGLVGTGVDSWAYRTASGDIESGNASILGGLDVFSVGVICCALDLDNLKIWFRRPGANWNGNASYDPATNVGGVTIGAGTWYPAASSSGGWTLNTGQEPFAGVRPANFFIWE